MFIYGKMAADAVAIMSYLAAVPGRKAGSGEIAAARRISPALAAKLLTHLAAGGFVKGQPGPGGGYHLAKAAREISLMDIASIFEQTDLPTLCPFGEGWCGKGDPCPLHFKIKALLERHEAFLKKTRLSIFHTKQASVTKRKLTALQERFSTPG